MPAMKWTKQISPSQVLQMIRAERDTKKAQLIFDSATGEYPSGFRHDHHTFALMIARFAAANQLPPAEALLCRMNEEGCGPSEEAFLPIIAAYGRSHRPLEALRVFRRMEGEFSCSPSHRCWVTVFSILVETNHLKMAHTFYKRMKEGGAHSSTAAYNVLVRAFCKSGATMGAALEVFGKMADRGCPPDAYTYSTLISGLSKLGRMEEAMKLFKEMDEKGCPPTVVTYSALIHGLCRCGRLDEAVEMFSSMSSKGAVPNVVTYSSLMDGLCKGGRSAEAIPLLEKMTSSRLQPNSFTYSTLIDGLCREGLLQEAMATLDRMRLHGKRPDAGLYGKLITGLCGCCRFQEAANFLDEMALCGVVPNRVTWALQVRIHNAVARGLCAGDDPRRASQVHRRMMAQGISTEPETYSLLVACLCKKGDFFRAAGVVEDMAAEGCLPDGTIWAAVVGGLWNRGKVREAAELLMYDLMTDAGPV